MWNDSQKLDRFNQHGKGELQMKKNMLVIFLCTVLAFSVGCEMAPLHTSYGEIVHNAVKEYYDSYEILGLIQLEKDGKPTLYNFCIVNNMQGGIDVICISYSKDINGNYTTSQSVIATDVIQNEIYAVNYDLEDTMVNFLICEKQDIPNSTLQKKNFTFNKSSLYFCIT